jgi:hypothetical protein
LPIVFSIGFFIFLRFSVFYYNPEHPSRNSFFIHYSQVIMTSQLNARHKPKFQLLTFYKFVDIPESELDAVAQEHLDFTRDIGLHGRVYIGTEGISSTVTGNLGQCWAYRAFLQKSKYFQDITDIDTKATPVTGHQFPRMSVKIRNEIVTF